MQDQLTTYVHKHLYEIPGFLSEVDALVICSLLKQQKLSGMSGHLCEIGVHHGRSYLLLALARQAGEMALGIDLYKDDAFSVGRHAGRPHAVRENARKLSITLSETEILKASSLDLTAAAILERIGGPIRFFCVDGGHSYEHVANDLRLAWASTVPGGIIVVDDFFNCAWPEVTFAVHNFLCETQEIAPVLITPSKLYLTVRSAAAAYQTALRSASYLRRNVRRTVRLTGHDVVLMLPSFQQRLRKVVHAVIDKYVPARKKSRHTS